MSKLDLLTYQIIEDLIRLKDNDAFKNLPESISILEDIHHKIQSAHSEKKVIHIYTDGSCVGAFGVSSGRSGGSGIYITDNHTNTTDEYSVRIDKRYVHTAPTNNLAELYAIFFACQELIRRGITGYTVVFVSDSTYCIGCYTKWYSAWKAAKFMNSKKQPVSHKELIIDTHKLLKKLKVGNMVSFQHIQSHGKNGAKDSVFYEGNKIADRLAGAAAVIE